MTREEALDYMWERNNENPKIGLHNHVTIRLNIEELIDQIYDEFEKQLEALQAPKTCELCEHWKRAGDMHFGDCSLNVSSIPRADGITKIYFGCNMYEQKDTQ